MASGQNHHMWMCIVLCINLKLATFEEYTAIKIELLEWTDMMKKFFAEGSKVSLGTASRCGANRCIL